ncbi:selenocysteine-specific translation elongation factor [Thermovibrio sp.]
MQSKKFLVVGTAGHIDHGKTSLIRALTGVDTDRWEEEKRRGMTIDLGFAHLELPSGILAGIVDVPGHEKFIKNMLAGAHGLDLVLFVIAADEGVMPQTKEHLTVCQSLGTKRGIVVLTKKDLVDEEWLELVKEEVKEFTKGTFLEGAPIVAVSSKTGEGIKELLNELDKVAKEVEPKPKEGILRLPVDRSFTVKGFGTVITGTLLSGMVKVGDEVEITPKGIKCKVRGIQVHGKKVEEAVAGQRTALNLSSVKKEEVKRGDLVATPNYLKPTKLVDVELFLSKESEVIITSGFKVHFHHLTSESEGEVFLIDKEELLPGEKGKAQIRLKEKVVPVFKDKFVVRNYSPAVVIGGGEVIDPLPHKRFRKRFKEEFVEKFKGLLSKKLKEKVLTHLKFKGPLKRRDFVQLLNLSPEKVNEVIGELLKEGKAVEAQGEIYPVEKLKEVKEKALEAVKEVHRKVPVAEGITLESLKSKLKESPALVEIGISGLLREGILKEEGGFISLKDFYPKEEGEFKKLVPEFEEEIRKELLADLKEVKERLGINEEKLNQIASYLVRRKGYHRFGNLMASPESFKMIKEKLKRHFKERKELTVGEFKDLFGISRRFAIPLLEYLDSIGITVRDGSVRRAGEKLWESS